MPSPSLLLTSTCSLVALLAPLTLHSGGEGELTPRLRHLVLLEHGPHWPSSLDGPEMATLRAHGAHVARLLAEGKVLFAGPAPDRSCGVLVFDVAERDELERLLAADPAVAGGLFVSDVRPFLGGRAEDTWPTPALPATPAGLEPVVRSVVVPATLAEVWRAWSTPEGAQAFFAPRVELELAPLGRLEVLFFPDAPAGQRGAEGLRVLAFAPERMLAFEWNAPPQFARARPERTFVVVTLTALGAERTRVELLHQGFAEQAARAADAADEWRATRSYFQEAWGVVLGRLVESFEHGPLDWGALATARAK
jgi:uncharacterized protein YndB with AHSA1/START domain/uncharacterized protein YciI